MINYNEICKGLYVTTSGSGRSISICLTVTEAPEGPCDIDVFLHTREEVEKLIDALENARDVLWGP